MSADITFSTASGAWVTIGEGSLTGMDRQGVSADTTFSTASGAWNATVGDGSLTGSI